MTPQHDPASPRGASTVRLLFAVLALASLAIGLALYAFAERLGLDADTARYLVTAFLATAMADALILYVWTGSLLGSPDALPERRQRSRVAGLRGKRQAREFTGTEPGQRVMLGRKNRLASDMTTDATDDKLEDAVAWSPARPRHRGVGGLRTKRCAKLLRDLPRQDPVVRVPLLADIDAAARKLPKSGVCFADEQRTAVANDEGLQADFEGLDGARHGPDAETGKVGEPYPTIEERVQPA